MVQHKNHYLPITSLPGILPNSDYQMLLSNKYFWLNTIVYLRHFSIFQIEPNWNVLDDNFQTLMQEATYQFSFYLSVWENGFNKKPFHTTNVQDLLDDMYQLSLPPKKPQVKSNDLSTNKTDAILKTASSMRKGNTATIIYTFLLQIKQKISLFTFFRTDLRSNLSAITNA